MAEFVVEFGRDGPPPADGRLDAAAFHRNHQPIWSVLAPFLEGKVGDVLEVGSGTGQHVMEFARQSPGIVWWPSDYNEKHLQSIEAWRLHSELPNIRPPLRIDLLNPDWILPPDGSRAAGGLLAIHCANVIHIAPWQIAENLLAGAPRQLRSDGRLFLYGPFMRDGRHTAPSNAEFDASLRASNPDWGVRDIADLRAVADRVGLRIAAIAEMPANNLTLVFERIPG